MATYLKPPQHQWLVQEPEGPGAPRTPGRWKAMWASDCMRLETAHQNGDEECVVFGRKYVVDMKERKVRPLYWAEEPEWRPVVRATYFLKKGSGWLPYPEKDADTLEDTFMSAKVQLAGQACQEVEVPLSDGENKVVMSRKAEVAAATEESDAPREVTDFKIECSQRPVKALSILTTTFTRTTYDVYRGTPEPGNWGGISCKEEEHPREDSPPDHLVFVVHGIGESLWTRSSSSMATLRTCCSAMREISIDYRKYQKREADAKQAKERKKTEADAVTTESSTGEGQKGGTDGKDEEGRKRKEDTDKGVPGEKEAGKDEAEGEGEDGSAVGYVEFLPVEWFDQVHGDEAVEDGLIRDITLPSLIQFRDFASQAIMDVMYYLTPSIQERMLTRVTNEMNRMWEAFIKHTPHFAGKVSIVGHSLGSIIAHDILSAQPPRNAPPETVTEQARKVPILKFDPELFLACGSPIGTFLSLRADSLDKAKLFKFSTTKRFYNIFHPADPVAYRLEPMLDRSLKDLAPANMPHKGGDRIHIRVKKMNQHVAANMNAVVNKVSKTANENVNILHKRWSAAMKSVIGTTAPIKPAATTEEVMEAKIQLKERIDWALQETPFEGMNPWAAAVYAHGSYFQSVDLIMFLVNALDEKPLEEDLTRDEHT